MRRKNFFVLLALLCPFTAAQALVSPETLKSVIEGNFQINAPKTGLVKVNAVKNFYFKNGGATVWLTETGEWNQKARIAIKHLKQAHLDGLNLSDYHLDKLPTVPPIEPKALAQADIKLTAEVMQYGIDLKDGRPQLRQVDSKFFKYPKEADPVVMLQQGLAAPDFDKWLSSLSPSSSSYMVLKSVLSHYRDIKIKGGWPSIGKGKALKLGVVDARVPKLRQSLSIRGDLASTQNTTSKSFDKTLETAVKRFQYRHGLKQDGSVGPKTLGVLNKSVDKKIAQVLVNMERRRWVDDHPKGKWVEVNVAGFYLKGYEGTQEKLAMDVIVGKRYRKTPIFSAPMTDIILNPSWHVPYSIATKDILPKLQRDPGYLSRNNFVVTGGWDDEGSGIDWNMLSRRDFPYRLRQLPGPGNALGVMRFSIKNPYAIFLHDTNKRYLFAKTNRTLSSGCIRVSKPMKLASFVFEGSNKWNSATLQERINLGDTKRVYLPKHVPVSIVYFTSWVDTKGLVIFRKDVYKRDRVIKNKLKI